MSEPIKLYSPDGGIVITFAPSEALRMVRAGEALEEPPAPKAAPKPAPAKTTRRKAAASKG